MNDSWCGNHILANVWDAPGPGVPTTRLRSPVGTIGVTLTLGALQPTIDLDWLTSMLYKNAGLNVNLQNEE